MSICSSLASSSVYTFSTASTITLTFANDSVATPLYRKVTESNITPVELPNIEYLEPVGTEAESCWNTPMRKRGSDELCANGNERVHTNFSFYDFTNSSSSSSNSNNNKKNNNNNYIGNNNNLEMNGINALENKKQSLCSYLLPHKLSWCGFSSSNNSIAPNDSINKCVVHSPLPVNTGKENLYRSNTTRYTSLQDRKVNVPEPISRNNSSIRVMRFHSISHSTISKSNNSDTHNSLNNKNSHSNILNKSTNINNNINYSNANSFITSRKKSSSSIASNSSSSIITDNLSFHKSALHSQSDRHSLLLPFPTPTSFLQRSDKYNSNRCSESQCAELGSSSISVNEQSLSSRPQRRVTKYLEVETSFSMCDIPHLPEPSIKLTKEVVISRDEDGTMINDYLIMKTLGKGAYAKVKLVEHVVTGVKYAMKIIQLNGIRNSDERRIAIRREVTVMKRLAHPHVVKLYEVLGDLSAERMYLILEYIDGGCIKKEREDESGKKYVVPIPETVLRKQAFQLIQALAYLQANSIVHRDIKPDNILVDKNHNAYLADFGVSGIYANSNVRGVEGSPAYMSPELCRGDKMVIGMSVDVWALGVTLYELMYGVHPFTASNCLAFTHRITHDKLVFPELVEQEPQRCLSNSRRFTQVGHSCIVASPEFRELISGMLEKDPLTRWSIKKCLRCKWFQEIWIGNVNNASTHCNDNSGDSNDTNNNNNNYEITPLSSPEVKSLFSVSPHMIDVSQREISNAICNIYPQLKQTEYGDTMLK